MFYIMFFASVLSSWAAEGIYKPDSNHVSTGLKKALRSTAAVGSASGVVIENGLVITARHVVDDCVCPTPGSTNICIQTIRVPQTFSAQGEVSNWLTGQSDQIMACGENVELGKSELIEQTLKMLGTDAIYDLGLGPYWPRQDIALLHVLWKTEVPPAIEIRTTDLKPFQTIGAAGFPRRSLRDFEYKDLRITTMQKTLEQMSDLKVSFAVAQNVEDGLVQMRTLYDQSVKGWYELINHYADSSKEKIAIEDGAITSLSQIEDFLASAEAGGFSRACELRQKTPEVCQTNVMQRLIDLQITRTQTIVNSIRRQNRSPDYPEADGSLRVSIGQFRYYQNNPVPGIQGGISTDIDGVIGDSGGPLFDTDGKLIGMTVFAPAGSGLGYSSSNGITGVSHYGILKFLKK